jgi:hypothetical protein
LKAQFRKFIVKIGAFGLREKRIMNLDDMANLLYPDHKELLRLGLIIWRSPFRDLEYHTALRKFLHKTDHMVTSFLTGDDSKFLALVSESGEDDLSALGEFCTPDPLHFVRQPSQWHPKCFAGIPEPENSAELMKVHDRQNHVLTIRDTLCKGMAEPEFQAFRQCVAVRLYRPRILTCRPLFSVTILVFG